MSRREAHENHHPATHEPQRGRAPSGHCSAQHNRPGGMGPQGKRMAVITGPDLGSEHFRSTENNGTVLDGDQGPRHSMGPVRGKVPLIDPRMLSRLWDFTLSARVSPAGLQLAYILTCSANARSATADSRQAGPAPGLWKRPVVAYVYAGARIAGDTVDPSQSARGAWWGGGERTAPATVWQRPRPQCPRVEQGRVGLRKSMSFLGR